MRVLNRFFPFDYNREMYEFLDHPNFLGISEYTPVSKFAFKSFQLHRSLPRDDGDAVVAFYNNAEHEVVYYLYVGALQVDKITLPPFSLVFPFQGLFPVPMACLSDYTAVNMFEYTPPRSNVSDVYAIYIAILDQDIRTDFCMSGHCFVYNNEFIVFDRGAAMRRDDLYSILQWCASRPNHSHVMYHYSF